MLRKAFMTEADLEDVARLEAIYARSAERERRLAQGECSIPLSPRPGSASASSEAGDARAYRHCQTSH